MASLEFVWQGPNAQKSSLYAHLWSLNNHDFTKFSANINSSEVFKRNADEKSPKYTSLSSSVPVESTMEHQNYTVFQKRNLVDRRVLTTLTN